MTPFEVAMVRHRKQIARIRHKRTFKILREILGPDIEK